ncbi:MAG: hypothetical protein ACLR5G_08195 [Eubacteriales bacterium]
MSFQSDTRYDVIRHLPTLLPKSNNVVRDLVEDADCLIRREILRLLVGEAHEAVDVGQDADVVIDAVEHERAFLDS